MLVSNDTGQTKSAGDALSTAGAGLIASASAADLGDGAGGDAAPFTDRALGSLSRNWRVGLTRYGRQAEVLGSYANLVADWFEVLDGRH